MDRAVIYGIYDFMGFHLCTELLDQGLEVTGIHFGDDRNEDEVLMEKRLEIGRNANFQEIKDVQWLNPDHLFRKNTLNLIDFYSFYVQDSRLFMENARVLQKIFTNNLEEIGESASSIMFIFPIQWLGVNNEIHDYFNQLTQTLNGKKVSIDIMYLPTIFGPWQPNAFIFQQAILNKFHQRNQMEMNDWEWLDDAIFIDDAVKAILSITEQNSSGAWLLKSNCEDQWQKGAHYLSIPVEGLDMDKRRRPQVDGEIKELIVKREISISEGIEKQKQHLSLRLDGLG